MWWCSGCWSPAMAFAQPNSRVTAQMVAWTGLVIAAIAEVTTLVLVWPPLMVAAARSPRFGAWWVDRRRGDASAASVHERLSLEASVSLTNYSWPVAAIPMKLRHWQCIWNNTAVDTLWVADHLLQADRQPVASTKSNARGLHHSGLPGGPHDEASAGHYVTAATLRAPALLIKAVTTVDVLSPAALGWASAPATTTDEARAMGLFLPAPLSDRLVGRAPPGCPPDVGRRRLRVQWNPPSPRETCRETATGQLAAAGAHRRRGGSAGHCA